METIAVSFIVNGSRAEVHVSPDTTLLKVLRDDLELKGTKEGCGKGDCGACTVLMDGAAISSCITLAVQADGREITTVEGLAGAELHPLQRAFIEEGAVQCGFCIPGMLMSAAALLRRTPRPDSDTIRRGLSGNLCRCTGYQKIIKAVEKASIAACKGAD